jgi:hypothetical protein
LISIFSKDRNRWADAYNYCHPKLLLSVNVINDATSIWS